MRDVDQEQKIKFELTEVEADLRAEDLKICPRNHEKRNLWREALVDLGEPAKLTLVYLMRKLLVGGYVWVPHLEEALKPAKKRLP